ncbi:hypothetical protein MP228_012749 [Amoeboaphelidium protococcarum]|nr:hypothetical protein MP228_012749 [Amoeboaphelidium protococcarum]
MIFDWSQVDDLEYFHVYGAEWKLLVKQHICIFNDQKRAEIGVPPLLFEEHDVVEGPVTRNYKAIQSCSEPLSGAASQVVVLRRHDKILLPRLVGVIYLI